MAKNKRNTKKSKLEREVEEAIEIDEMRFDDLCLAALKHFEDQIRKLHLREAEMLDMYHSKERAKDYENKIIKYYESGKRYFYTVEDRKTGF